MKYSAHQPIQLLCPTFLTKQHVLTVVHLQYCARAAITEYYKQVPCVCAKSLSRVPLFETPWTVALQTSLSMGFSRQEYWSRLLCPPPGDHPDLGI